MERGGRSDELQVSQVVKQVLTNLSTEKVCQIEIAITAKPDLEQKSVNWPSDELVE